jgi:hypothetical protein
MTYDPGYDASVALAVAELSERMSPRRLLAGEPALYEQWCKAEETVARWRKSFADMLLARSVRELSEAVGHHDAMHDDAVRALLVMVELRALMIRKAEMDSRPFVVVRAKP